MPLIARKGVAAIAAVLDIALNHGKPLSAVLLEERHGLPRRYLEPFLQEMVRRGMLKGMRGPRGGYKLANDPGRISVLEILRAVEAVDTVDHQVPKGSALIGHIVLPVLTTVERSFTSALMNVSLKDLADSAAGLGQVAE